MNIILLGAPGAGKGTQAEVICKALNIPTISTGNMLRAAVKAGTEYGLKAKAAMDAGDLVSDDIVIGILKDRIAEPDAHNGFILDGFPRTLPQAEVLEEMLAKKGIKLDAVIEIQVPDEIIMERILGRYSCMTCGAGYHDKFQKPKVYGVCDVCGGTDFYRRVDDNRATVQNRLVNYRALTYPTIPYFEKKGLLRCVDGTGTIEATSKKIDDLLAVA